jgi:hypothetical protein
MILLRCHLVSSDDHQHIEGTCLRPCSGARIEAGDVSSEAVEANKVILTNTFNGGAKWMSTRDHLCERMPLTFILKISISGLVREPNLYGIDTHTNEGPYQWRL